MSSPAAVRVEKKLPPLRRTARVAEPIWAQNSIPVSGRSPNDATCWKRPFAVARRSRKRTFSVQATHQMPTEPRLDELALNAKQFAVTVCTRVAASPYKPRSVASVIDTAQAVRAPDIAFA